MPERQKAKSWSCVFLLAVDLCTTAKGLRCYGGEHRDVPLPRSEDGVISVRCSSSKLSSEQGPHGPPWDRPPQLLHSRLMAFASLSCPGPSTKASGGLEAAGPTCFHLCALHFHEQDMVIKACLSGQPGDQAKEFQSKGASYRQMHFCYLGNTRE